MSDQPITDSRIAGRISNPDSWIGVEDPKLRKRIQDRLAQRARRSRLSKQQKQRNTDQSSSTSADKTESTRSLTLRPITTEPSSEPQTESRRRSCDNVTNNHNDLATYRFSDLRPLRPSAAEPDAENNGKSPRQAYQTAHIRSEGFSSPTTEKQAISDAVISTSETPESSTLVSESASTPVIVTRHNFFPPDGVIIPNVLPRDEFFLPNRTAGAMGALWQNGFMLGLLCTAVQPPATSADYGKDAHIPSSLHSSTLQRTTPHHLWIDRFPFPRLRDNIILMADVLNLEEFAYDIFTMVSFVLVGELSYDPTAFRIGPEFVEKWGYLFL